MGRITFRPNLDDVTQRGNIARTDVILANRKQLQLYNGDLGSLLMSLGSDALDVSKIFSLNELRIRDIVDGSWQDLKARTLQFDYSHYEDEFFGQGLDAVKWSTTVVGGGSIIKNTIDANGRVTMQTGSVTLGDNARIHMNGYQQLNAGAAIILEMAVQIPTANLNCRAFFGMVSTNFDPNSFPLGSNYHILAVVNPEGNANWGISTADGVTQSAEYSTTTLPHIQARWRLEFIPGTKVDFYKNDVLLQTKTTNLPPTSSMQPFAGIASRTVLSNRQLTLDRVVAYVGF